MTPNRVYCGDEPFVEEDDVFYVEGSVTRYGEGAPDERQGMVKLSGVVLSEKKARRKRALENLIERIHSEEICEESFGIGIQENRTSVKIPEEEYHGQKIITDF